MVPPLETQKKRDKAPFRRSADDQSFSYEKQREKASTLQTQVWLLQ